MNIMLNITLHAFVALSPLVAAVSALADTVWTARAQLLR